MDHCQRQPVRSSESVEIRSQVTVVEDGDFCYTATHLALL